MKNIGTETKPSTAISIFEKVVEPILTYNSEISQAYLPKNWDYNKFHSKIMDLNKELNKVTIGFLRQILGVHKKTTIVAILAETGKLPISYKIFNSIYKYWIRSYTCDSELVKEAMNCNMSNHQRGVQSWIKIVQFILRLTNMQNHCPTNDLKLNNKLITTFQKNLKTTLMMDVQDRMINLSKLDFYNKYKKTYKFEKYLDNVPRHLRIYATRLRLSSHNFPVEILRYTKKKKKKIPRSERLCKICNSGSIGDEEHYLQTCQNQEIVDIRNNFTAEIKNNIGDLHHFTQTDIIRYCMILHDDRIQNSFSSFVKNILDKYREISEDSGYEPPTSTQTRSGRLVKRPNKLNL
jgi:hypothetical protein